MKKHILLALGAAAIYLAAKEYGINSLDDLKKLLRPYMKMLDLNSISGMVDDVESKKIEDFHEVTHES